MLPLDVVGPAAESISQGVVGIQLDGFGIVRQRLREVPAIGVGAASDEIGGRVFRVEPDGLGAIREALRGLLQVKVDPGAENVDPGGGFQFQGGVAVRQGAFAVALLGQGQATDGVGQSGLWVELHGAVALRKRRVGLRQEQQCPSPQGRRRPCSDPVLRARSHSARASWASLRSRSPKVRCTTF